MQNDTGVPPMKLKQLMWGDSVLRVIKIPALAIGVVAAVLVVSLSACVTSTTGGFTDEAAPEIALERRVELARNYIGEGNWKDAKRNLELAAAIDPDNAEVHEAFALVYQSTGEYELAEERFAPAVGSRDLRHDGAALLAGPDDSIGTLQSRALDLRDGHRAGKAVPADERLAVDSG